MRRWKGRAGRRRPRAANAPGAASETFAAAVRACAPGRTWTTPSGCSPVREQGRALDELIGQLRAPVSALPKGVSGETERLVTELLRASAAPRSATEVADSLGISRVTARRYLEHLADA